MKTVAASPIHKDDWDHLFVQCLCDAISSPIGQPILLCTNEIKSIMSIISQPQTPNKDNVSRFFALHFYVVRFSALHILVVSFSADGYCLKSLKLPPCTGQDRKEGRTEDRTGERGQNRGKMTYDTGNTSKRRWEMQDRGQRQ